MTNLDRILASRNITLTTKDHMIKAMIFPAVVYGCESWTVENVEHPRNYAFKLWCWRRLLRVSWTARRPNQSYGTIQKIFNCPDNQDGVFTHLEPDILGCEFKWVLRSIAFNKTSGGDGIPAELLKILKDNAVKALQVICQQIWKFASSHRTEKASFHSNPKEKHWQRVFKLPYNWTHFTC